LIPREYIQLAGGAEDGVCYVTFDEDTKEIKIVIKDNSKKNGGVPDG
jgi:hypothetical protein